MARLSFKTDGEIKRFSDKQKLTKFNTTKTALQQMTQRLKQSGNTREEKDLQNQTPRIKKMATETYISIITLSINGLNAPTERHKLAKWIQRPIYMLSTRNPLLT